MQVKAALPVKFILSISMLIVLTSVILGWFFIRHDVQLITRALLDRGTSLARNLASNLGYELQYASEQRLHELIDGVIKQEDVLYVVIQDEQGQIRTQAKASQLKTIPPGHMQRSALPGVSGADPVTRAYVVRWGGEQIYEIVHPITTQVKREREEIGLSLGGTERTIGWAGVGMSLSLQRVNETLIGVQWTIVMLTLGVIVLGIVVTALLVQVIVRPIKQLVAATRRIAAGELGFTVAVTSKDELGDLAASFNRMAEVLRERESDNTRLVQALEETNGQLEAASRHKSAFLANMSHELRTPLNSIIGFSEVLLDEALGELSPDERREFLGNILSSGRHLLTLINDILDLSKIEAGRMELYLEECTVAAVMSGVFNTIQPLAARKQIAVEAAIDPALPTLVADTGKVKQILYNLLSNAVKFTPEHGRIGVRATRRHEAAQFVVWDTGIGITSEDQERIFAEFQQVETTAARQYEGTGLGLTLAQKFVELHGGSIWVESVPGQGSTFSFTLPLAALPAVTMVARAAPQERTRPLVLVVEDDAPTRELLRFSLAREGFQVQEARDGEEAVHKARTLQPVLITLDILLPRKDGWEVLRELKEDAITRDIPVIILSIVDDPERGFSLGAADYLLKPFDREDLLRCFGRYSFPTKVRGAPVQILIIDDDPGVVETFAGILEPVGFRICKAYGGREGLALAMAQQPDLIVLDLVMPDISGFEVVQRLQQHPHTREIPVFVVTARDLRVEEKQALNSLVTAVMRKETFVKDVFLEEIGTLMRRMAAQERRAQDGGRTDPTGGG
jgi:signal transduction histidine kinase/CheY-like chemotaxis protein